MAAMPYPVGTITNEAGHLEIGGCGVIELAREFRDPGLPVRGRRDARTGPRLPEGFAAHTSRFEVLFASKALPVTAAYRLFAEEDSRLTWLPAAS